MAEQANQSTVSVSGLGKKNPNKETLILSEHPAPQGADKTNWSELMDD